MDSILLCSYAYLWVERHLRGTRISTVPTAVPCYFHKRHSHTHAWEWISTKLWISTQPRGYPLDMPTLICSGSRKHWTSRKLLGEPAKDTILVLLIIKYCHIPSYQSNIKHPSTAVTAVFSRSKDGRLPCTNRPAIGSVQRLSGRHPSPCPAPRPPSYTALGGSPRSYIDGRFSRLKDSWRVLSSVVNLFSVAEDAFRISELFVRSLIRVSYWERCWFRVFDFWLAQFRRWVLRCSWSTGPLNRFGRIPISSIKSSSSAILLSSSRALHE